VEKLILQELKESIEVKEAVIESLIPQITEATRLVIDAFKKGKKLILFGNGGSAADAQHIACELVGRLGKERKALPAIALSTNTSNLTAIGNDYGFEATFSRQMEALASEGDVALGISTSGKSPNVLEAFKVAKERGLKTIALSGKGGGSLKNLADICIVIPSNNIARIQEAHITIGHSICMLIEKELFKHE
jgi:D-sedoheptulose 7-phosphate isomerase